jgi:hypothetical protein
VRVRHLLLSRFSDPVHVQKCQRRLNRAAMRGDSFHAATTGRMSSMVKLVVLLIVLFSAGTFLAHAIEAYRDGYLRRFK